MNPYTSVVVLGIFFATAIGAGDAEPVPVHRMGVARPRPDLAPLVLEADLKSSEVFSCSPASAPRYIQGVCNGEGAAAEISSAIFGLNWLFLGGPTPPCRKACDTDGNGDVNITDMVHLLNFLFLGGFPPSLWEGPNPICSAVGPEDDCEFPNSACPLR